ncbi:T9SS type A sorting domain-containing protein [Chryseolinea sp. T2]|uniref:T9SS type A sorting domain-containing protein n=1 Tax=Chryseolinea sp. T2 TaxID=3129255 RepID=UPI00307829CB
MRLCVILILIVLPVSFRCYSQSALWNRTLGPAGGSVDDIVRVDNYLLVNAGPGGVYRSADDGDHWDASNIGLPLNPHCYALASSENVLFAAIAGNGIYKSTDFGGTWVRAGSELQGKTFYSLLANNNDVYAGSSESGFYHSANGGASWTLKGKDLRQVGHFLVVGNSLFIGATNASSVAAVYKSTDKGTTLTDINAPVTSINSMAGYDNAIYVTGGQPTAISRDYGATWTTSSIGTTGYYMLTSIYAHEERVIIPAGNSTLFVSQDEGLHWETINTLSYKGVVNTIYCEDNKIIVGGREGIYISNDNATTWQEKSKGLLNMIITQLKATNDELFAGTGVGVFASSDNGQSWNKRNDGLEDNSPAGYIGGVVVKGLHVTPDYVITATGKGIFKSANSGITWNLKRGLQGGDPNNYFQILAGDKDRVFACEQGQQHYSTSAGETWATRTDTHFNGMGIINAAVRGDTIVVLANENILISNNFGITWESSRVLPTYFYPNEVAIGESKVYLATYQGLFVTDNLQTWTKIQGLPVETILSVVKTSNALYVGTTMGVYVSYNEGLNWYPLNNGLSDGFVAPLAFNAGNAFAGTYGSSVWRALRNNLNVTPVITRLKNEIEYTENQDIIIDVENIVVSDPDNVPGDFTLAIRPGAHYNVSGNVVTPEANYTGPLEIPLVVSDGYNESDRFIATVNMITGLAEVSNGFELFPIPATQQINFRTTGAVTSWSVTDLTGRRILYKENIQMSGEAQSIDISQLPDGIYFIELLGDSNQRQRFLKH